MANRMIPNETAWFDRGVINALTDEVARRGYRKALIVTDSTPTRCGVAAKITDKLDAAGLTWDMFSDVIPSPTVAAVQQGLQVFQHGGADYLIAIGSGPPQDTYKTIDITQRSPKLADVRSPEGLLPARQPSIPIFAVPTTAGTVAEVMIDYVTTDEEQRHKFACVDPRDIPQVTFIDTDTMDAASSVLKMATDVDALAHAIEGYLTRGTRTLTDALYLKTIEVIAEALRGSVTGDADVGEAMALGQYAAGMEFSNARLGLVHDVAHPLDAFYNTPHGVVNIILLPHVMRFNAGVVGEKYHDITRSMGVRVEVLSLTAARQVAVEAVCQLNHDVGISGHLRETGVRKEDTPAPAQATLEDVCTGGNPREANLIDIVELYQVVW